MNSTRERILDAAWELAMEHGYRGTTLAMIQTRAAVHPGSFYWHFSDKDALFQALVARARTGSSVMVDHLDRDVSNPVQAVLDTIVTNPQRFGLWRFNVQLMMDPAMSQSATAEEIRALREDIKRILTAAWLEQVPPAVLAAAPELPERMAQYSLAVMEGCVLSRVAGTPRDEAMLAAMASYTVDRMVASVCDAIGEPVPDFFRSSEGALAQYVPGRHREEGRSVERTVEGPMGQS